MSSLNYKNPLSPLRALGPQSVNSDQFIGTHYSTLGVGGYMEVYNVSDLYYTVPGGQYGTIKYSGNTIPINFYKGSGTSFSYNTLTLNSDNISSGRKKLGMLAYVYETDQIYQFVIDNYDSLWSAATASTGTVVITDFGTTVRGSTPEGAAFIAGWTGNTVEGISGATSSTAVWKKLATGGGGGSGITGGTYYPNTLTLDLESTGGTISIGNVTGLYVSAGTYTSGTSTLDLFNSTGGTISITGITAGSGGSGGTSNFQYFISGSSPTGTINDGDRWFYTESGEEFVWITDQNSSQWVQPVSISYGVSEEFVHITGDTMTGTLYVPTISAATYQNLPGSSSSNCQTTFYVTNISGCSPVNMLTEVNMLSGLTVTGTGYFTGTVTASTISATTYQNYPTNFTSGLTATTISATTYLNLPTDVRTTGGTYSNNTFTFTNNTGGTYSALFNTVTGLTVNGGLTVTGNTSLQALTATTISATTYQNLPTDIRVTGATYSNNTFTYTNNTGGTFNVLFNTVTGLTINGNISTTGTTSFGNGTFTKGGSGTGDVFFDNNTTDTPATLFYYANNSNYGIDSWNGSFDVLSGQLLRFTNKLNETGGAVKAAIDTSGNLAVGGFVKANAWRAGQVINDIMLSNTEVTVSTTTIATSNSDTDFVTYSYTPLSSTSYLVIHYHLASFSFEGGTGNDSYFSRIKVDGGEITYSRQSTVNGNRTGVLFPLTGRYTNSNTTAKSIVVACRRDSADDNITIVNSSSSMWLRITEIAR
jgi:hypothetical protein